MHVQSNLTTPVIGEKRQKPLKRNPPASDTRKVSSFIQKFYLFGTSAGAPCDPQDIQSSVEVEQPKVKKAKPEDLISRRREPKLTSASSAEDSCTTQSSSDVSKESIPAEYPSYSVQRLRQFWNNRLLSSANQRSGTNSGTSIDTLVRKTKSATIGTPTGAASRDVYWNTSSPKAVSRFQRNGSIGRSGKRRSIHDNSDTVRIAPDRVVPGSSVTITHGHKRTSNAALLSPDRETQQQVEKRKCVGSGALAVAVPATVSSGNIVRDSFPLATSTPYGNQIHWARRTELLGIRSLTQDEKNRNGKMPIRAENYVNNFIEVDIQSVPVVDAVEPTVNVHLSNVADSRGCSGKMSKLPEITRDDKNEDLPLQALPSLPPETLPSQPSSSSLGRKGNTPTRKISFMNNISPYNRRLLSGNGTKVAALTSKFNQMIQQDAGLLEQVKKRGGYIHKCGNVAYKVLEDTSGQHGTDTCGFTTASRNSVGRVSLRKKTSNASAVGGGCRTDESSDEVSSASSKSSSVRKTGVKKRPSLRKNIYRRPEWAETGRSSLGVRKVLEMFEPNVHHSTPRGRNMDDGGTFTHRDAGKPPPGRSKPKVPDKSEQVLQKTKDINSQKVWPVSSEAIISVCDSTSDGEGKDKISCILEIANNPKSDINPQAATKNNTAISKSQSTVNEPTETNVEPAEPNNHITFVEEKPFKEERIVQTKEEILKSTPINEIVNHVKETKEKKKTKSAVSKIYERLTFRSSKKMQIDTSPSVGKQEDVLQWEDDNCENKVKPSRQSYVSSLEIPTINIEESESEQLPSETTKEADVSEQKILEAICAASHKIDNLSKSFNDLTLDEPVETLMVVKINKPNADGLQVRPNTSFLFRECGSAGPGFSPSGGMNASQLSIVEAVNTVVINKAVSMDDHHFPCARGSAGRMSLNERSATQRDLEDDYELVTKPEEKQVVNAQLTSEKQSLPCSSSTISIDLTELTNKIESFIHKSKRESENIYQSISRTSSVSRTIKEASHKTHLVPEDTVSINSYESFENYESIAQGDVEEQVQDQAAREEDTYEVCSPPPDLPPARDDCRNDLTLPQPKRNLSSSPKTLPKHLQVTYQSNYQKIKYSKIPPRPPKPDEIPLPPRNNSNSSSCNKINTINLWPISDRLDHTLESISSAELSSLSPGEHLHEPRNNCSDASSTTTNKNSGWSTSDQPNLTTESLIPIELSPHCPRGDLLDKSPHGMQKHSIFQQGSCYEENIYDTIRSADGVDYEDPARGGSSELEDSSQNRLLYEQEPRDNSSAPSTKEANTICIPPRTVSDRLDLTLEGISSAELSSVSPCGNLLDKLPHGHQEHSLNRRDNVYKENIYDTIRSGDGLDYDDPACGGSSELEVPHHKQGLYVLQQQQPPSPPADTVSLVSSNCYESIGSRLEFVRNLALNRRNIGGSTTTLASDHITNSLYGTTAGLASLAPPSERGSDTSNSADWTDISDEDEVERNDGVATASKRPNFIVVRERKRIHQTPLRSRKLPRISHQKTDDDSDHHYESLYSIGSNECNRNGSERSRASSCATTGQQQVQPAPFSDSTIHKHRGDPSQLVNNDDEFDSFDSDDMDEGEDEEEDEEDEERSRNRTDSGVDIRNAKLPDPPSSNSQVYVLVQKIKNLGTLSKSEIAKGFNKLSKKKSPKGGAATYENSSIVLPPKPMKSSSKSSSKAFKLPIPLGGSSVPKPPPEDYENTQLGKAVNLASPTYPSGSSPPPLLSQPCSGTHSTTRALISSPSSSEQALSAPLLRVGVRSTSESSNVSNNRPPSTTADTTRKKSKSTKSLRSKLRKSLVSESTSLNIGSSFNGSRSTFYITTSPADVDSGIFNGMEASHTQTMLVSPVEPTPESTGDAINNDGQKTAPHGVAVDNDNRRKSIALGTSSRPSIPPPPPPAEGPTRKAPSCPLSGSKSSTRKLGATSWYAECGVFKQPHSFGTDCDQPLPKGGGSSPRSPLPPNESRSVSATTSAASWYADIYQTSGASVASSSESSGVSTGGEGGPGDDHSHSMFVNEPLYQIYNAAKLESITRDIDAEISGHSVEELYDDGYEKISERNRRRAEDEGGSTSGSSSADGDDRSESSLYHLRKPSRPTALELIEPHVGKLRTLWCEVPEVRNSEILATLTPTEKRLQEAKFEILTSEASYLKSLNLLRTHFVNHPAFRDQRILSPSDRKTLFSSIIPVQECSDRLLCDLENCWQDNIMLLGLSHSIFKHAEKHFHVYVSYCEHQAKIDRTLKTLKATRPEFVRTLTELEADPVCCSLSLSSFLMLPMQRITRMRLLLDAVLQRCHQDDDEFVSWEKTFVLINRILTQCNDAAHRSEQMHEMERLSRQIEFPTNVRPLAIVPCGIGAAPSSMHRKLEKRGELVHLLWRGDDAKLTFGKKFSKNNVYAFLFTDLLVLTRKKSDENFLVIDYCQRALLAVNSGDIVPGLPAKEMQTIGKKLIIMTLLENHEGKTVEMFLSCPSETERERWLMVTEPPASGNPDEKIYEQWDCPQVIAVHPYEALQPDELDLDIKDVVNVHRKMADGWYEGERIRDGAVGWFPSNYTKEIPSAHIRAKHIKQRHMLLTYTSKYIDTASKSHSHYHYGKK